MPLKSQISSVKSGAPAMLGSPLAWTGGKSRLRGEIVRRMPKHTTYVELFAGAAWVLLGKDPEISKSEVLNDLDGELINFWRVLRHRPAEFAEEARWALASRELWNEWRSLPSEGSELNRALRFYVVIKCSFGGMRNSTAFRTCRTVRPASRWVDLLAESGALFARLRRVWIEHMPWHGCLARYDAPQTFFYADPPYRCGGANAYLHRFSDQDHERLAEALKHARGKWLLSYNDDPIIRRLYRAPGVTIERVSVPYSIGRVSRQRATELLIRNYPLPASAKLAG